MPADLTSVPHRRQNILTGEWVLVSPHRMKRPWQGEVSQTARPRLSQYDPECYLCPGNLRANGERNPDYKGTFSFTNDFSALLPNTSARGSAQHALLAARPERGLCRVVNFSPRHDLTLADLAETDIAAVITTWQDEVRGILRNPKIRHIQIFENKGAMMGNSNPHPHCQIWAQESVPMEPGKELVRARRYFARHSRPLLSDYVKLERKAKVRILFENGAFVALVPFWAVWPYETLLVPRRRVSSILDLRDAEVRGFANALSRLTKAYDALFDTSFPYSSGIHMAPTDKRPHPEVQMHVHFYPPLLRSASVRKFMVGYEMLAEPQRDITPEQCAATLREVLVRLSLN